MQSHNWVGQHIPLHATSNGKVLLSELSEAELKDAVRALPRVTDQTVTNRSKLRDDLGEVREAGYAVAVDELEVGLTAAAAPIRKAHGDIIASMSISGPTFRLTEEKLEEAVPMLVAAATEVSHRLGWGQTDLTRTMHRRVTTGRRPLTCEPSRTIVRMQQQLRTPHWLRKTQRQCRAAEGTTGCRSSTSTDRG